MSQKRNVVKQDDEFITNNQNQDEEYSEEEIEIEEEIEVSDDDDSKKSYRSNPDDDKANYL